MALLPSSLRTVFHISSKRCLHSFQPPLYNPLTLTPPSFNPLTRSKLHKTSNPKLILAVSYRYFTEDEEDADEDHNFDEAVALFNGGEYYKCHDYLEALWNNAEEPTRTLIHGILQCAVGFHHLFNQNHRGAMMQLGEGLCKLRKMEFSNGPFHKFEKEISAVLDFIFQTQIELAACSEDMCVAMDQSERSYQLLGEYAAGQRIYDLELGHDASVYIVFCPQGSYGATEPPREARWKHQPQTKLLAPSNKQNHFLFLFCSSGLWLKQFIRCHHSPFQHHDHISGSTWWRLQHCYEHLCQLYEVN